MYEEVPKTDTNIEPKPTRKKSKSGNFKYLQLWLIMVIAFLLILCIIWVLINDPFLKASSVINPSINNPTTTTTTTTTSTPQQSHSSEPIIKNLKQDSPSLRPKYPTYISPVLQQGISTFQIISAVEFLQLKSQSADSFLSKYEKEYYQSIYSISLYQELPFCIVVPSFNNFKQNRYLNNINSILQQNYSNYRVVIIDDASEDGTAEAIRNYINKHEISENKVKLIVNEKRKLGVNNIYWAAMEFCKPYEIFMVVDGDDELVGKQVLKHFNSIYQSEKMWVVYSNFIFENMGLGNSNAYDEETISANNYRREPFIISQLRTCYTKLIQLIKPEDLQSEGGEWLLATYDMAMFIPAMEMAHQKVLYTPQISYLYNSNTGLNDHNLKLNLQRNIENYIRLKTPYKPLKSLLTQTEKEELLSHTGLNIQIKIEDAGFPDLTALMGWEKK